VRATTEKLEFVISPSELARLVLRTEAHIEVLKLAGFQEDPQKLLDVLNNLTLSEAVVNADFSAEGIESIPLSREILYVLFDDAEGDLLLSDILYEKFGKMAEVRYDEIFTQNHAPRETPLTQEEERNFAVDIFLQVFAESAATQQEKANV